MSALPPSPDLIDVQEKIRRIVIYTNRPSVAKFFATVSAAQQAYAKRATAPSRQHVPDAVADHDGGSNGDT
jgi:hypothetical protein